MKRVFSLFFAVCVISVLGVISFADGNTGVSYSSSSDKRSPASSSDLVKYIFLDDEDNDGAGSALSGGMRGVNDFGYYIDISDTVFGSRLYIPSDYIQNSFYINSSGYLFGCRSSSFTVYAGNYSIRFPSYGTPQYRLTNGQQQTWTDINIEYIDSPNVSVEGARINFWDERIKTVILVVLGGLVVCLYMKR